MESSLTLKALDAEIKPPTPGLQRCSPPRFAGGQAAKSTREKNSKRIHVELLACISNAIDSLCEVLHCCKM